MKDLNFRNIDFSYASESFSILENFNFHVEGGKIEALVGKSGVGKTTVLRLAAGILKSSSGSILMGEECVGEGAARVGFVAQNYALFPWLTTLQNIKFSAANLKLCKDESDRRARELGSLFELDLAFDKYPKSLSGGMKQRVAVARAIFSRPPLLCLDEPFSALDLCLREAAQETLKTAIKQYPSTVVFVTHDINEAISLADNVTLIYQETSGKPISIKRYNTEKLNIESEITRDIRSV